MSLADRLRARAHAALDKLPGRAGELVRKANDALGRPLADEAELADRRAFEQRTSSNDAPVAKPVTQSTTTKDVAPVIVYHMDKTRRDATKLTDMLDAEKIPYQVSNIQEDAAAQMAVRRDSKGHRLPVLFIAGEVVGGRAELSNLIATGDLKKGFWLINAWYGDAMTESEGTAKKLTKQATEKVLSALNRADEIGGEIRDFLQDKVAKDPRYVNARKKVASLLGKKYESKAEVEVKAKQHAEKVAKAAAVGTSEKPKNAGFGDPSIKAQLFGKKSCPWSGRAITLLERHKVDYDFTDLEEPEHEAKATPLALETKQNTVPYIYLRGVFIGGFNALSEIDRLGQLEVALMSAEERAAAPAHQRSVEIVARPNTDEVAPAESDASAE